MSGANYVTVTNPLVTSIATVTVISTPDEIEYILGNATPAVIEGNGTNTAVVYGFIVDQGFNSVPSSLVTAFDFTTNNGGWSGLGSFIGDGTYRRVLVSAAAATTTIVATGDFRPTIPTEPSLSEVSWGTVSFVVPGIDFELTQLTADPIFIDANGTSTSTIYVQLKDANGVNATNNSLAGSILLFTDHGVWFGDLTSVGNGLYTRVLVSSTQTVTAVITAEFGSVTALDTATVSFVEGAVSLAIASGNNQTVSIATSVGALSVTLFDPTGAVIRTNGSVTYAVSGGGGSGSGTVNAVNGVATIPAGSWTLGSAVGTNSLAVYLSGSSTFVTFTATADTGPAWILSASPASQTLVAGDTLTVSFRVVDAGNNPVSNVELCLGFDFDGLNLPCVDTVTTGVDGFFTTTDVVDYALSQL